MSDHEKIHQDFIQDGYVLLKQFFDPALISNIREEVAEANFSEIGCDVYFENILGSHTLKRVERFHDKFQPLTNLLKDPKYINLLHSILGEPPCLFKDKINFKSSGGSGFDLHVDGHFYWQTQDDGEKFCGWLHYGSYFLNAVIPLEPATKHNGALEVAKKAATAELLGSDWLTITNNLEAQGPFVDPVTSTKVQTETIEMDVGDILLFDWQCIHGSQANHSVSGRPILYVTYNRQSDGQNELKYFNDKSQSTATGDAKTLTR